MAPHTLDLPRHLHEVPGVAPVSEDRLDDPLATRPTDQRIGTAAE